MSLNTKLKSLADALPSPHDADIVRRAADEIESLQAKLDAVRALCVATHPRAVCRLFADKVLAVIEKGGGE